MDPILFIRQMMAESKFLEAQKQAESVLLNVKSSERSEIIFLYLEILSALNKHHPIELLLEAAEVLINTDVDKAQYWLSLIGNEHSSIYKKRIELLKIRIADKKGNLDEVYRLILNYQIHLFEHKAPTQVEAIQTFIEKYFKSDFNLKLHELAIQGMLCNLTAAERITRELIFSCSERSSSKGKLDKLSAIRDVLTTIKDKKHLEIYQNYCSILISSKGDKYDLKKLVEFVIYFDDFK